MCSVRPGLGIELTFVFIRDVIMTLQQMEYIEKKKILGYFIQIYAKINTNSQGFHVIHINHTSYVYSETPQTTYCAFYSIISPHPFPPPLSSCVSSTLYLYLHTMSEISASIEETNKIRASQGLPLLAVPTPASSSAASSSSAAATAAAAQSNTQSGTNEESAENAELRRLLAERRAARQSSRQSKNIQSQTRSIGSELIESGDVAATSISDWVQRNRTLSTTSTTSTKRKHKRKHTRKSRTAAAQADRLAEIDAELSEIGMTDTAAGAGMKVSHDMSDFVEGESVVLTLKDTGILTNNGRLNRDEDELENIDMRENEKLQHTLERRKKKAGYNPYAAAEDGSGSGTTLLSKYDDYEDAGTGTTNTTHGGGRRGFRLGVEKEPQTEQERSAQVRARLASLNGSSGGGAQAINQVDTMILSTDSQRHPYLDMDKKTEYSIGSSIDKRVGSDFYSAEEMSAMFGKNRHKSKKSKAKKKHKKKHKSKKDKHLRSAKHHLDLLVPDIDTNDQAQHRGTRIQAAESKLQDAEQKRLEQSQRDQNFLRALQKANANTKERLAQDTSVPINDDSLDDDAILRSSLARARAVSAATASASDADQRGDASGDGDAVMKVAGDSQDKIPTSRMRNEDRIRELALERSRMRVKEEKQAALRSEQIANGDIHEEPGFTVLTATSEFVRGLKASEADTNEASSRSSTRRRYVKKEESTDVHMQSIDDEAEPSVKIETVPEHGHGHEHGHEQKQASPVSMKAEPERKIEAHVSQTDELEDGEVHDGDDDDDGEEEEEDGVYRQPVVNVAPQRSEHKSFSKRAHKTSSGKGVSSSTHPTDTTNEDDSVDFLHDEPLASSGVAAALALAKRRGLLQQLAPKKIGRSRDAKVFNQRDAPDDDDDDDDVSASGGSSTGQRKFNFVIEQRDEFGRVLTEKEAYRYLSHAFHGQGAGKKTREKRMRKYLEEQKLINPEATLSAVDRLQEVQRATGKAHLVLDHRLLGDIATTKKLREDQKRKAKRDARNQKNAAAAAAAAAANGRLGSGVSSSGEFVTVAQGAEMLGSGNRGAKRKRLADSASASSSSSLSASSSSSQHYADAGMYNANTKKMKIEFSLGGKK
jgi:SART-1 family/HIND motif